MSTTSPLHLHGLIEARTILPAIDPQTCILCLSTKSSPGVNTICSACTTSLASDPALSFLHHTAQELYAFWIALLRRTLTREFEMSTCPKRGTSWSFKLGVPGAQKNLPMPASDTLELGQGEAMKLTAMEKDLLEEVLLQSMACAEAIQVLARLLQVHLLQDSQSPVQSIREILFEPAHPTCTNHWTFLVTLLDSRTYALNFSDRQLGWPRLLVSWPEYLSKNIKLDEAQSPIRLQLFDLGYWCTECWTEYCVRFHQVLEVDWDMVLEERAPEGWVAEEELGERERVKGERAGWARLEGRVEKLFEVWREGGWR
ncbi:hypothetical protein BDU57DRAFT_597733 [Ampelomyces quisqualis]|uniref:Uncharacterized protein n=1 Tax=Ampelomyces quisqualis TaxID=50730 RepID=A0A6A5QH37_AMPQU|nr:hypothetical protein BDU57DRAFT_597733 [Ampelomyces quisqualis]